MRSKRSILALLAGMSLGLAALAAGPASAAGFGSRSASSGGAASVSADAGQAWVQSSIRAQLARKPGGVVQGDSIRYVADDVTLTYKPAAAPGSVVPDDFAGCSTGEICVYTTSSVVSSGVRLSTGSLWCPWENARNLLDLRDYGLADQIRAADSENGWWAEGIWSRFGVRGEQWKMGPYGILSNLSPTNITYLNVCLKEGDLEY